MQSYASSPTAPILGQALNCLWSSQKLVVAAVTKWLLPGNFSHLGIKHPEEDLALRTNG